MINSNLKNGLPLIEFSKTSNRPIFVYDNKKNKISDVILGDQKTSTNPHAENSNFTLQKEQAFKKGFVLKSSDSSLLKLHHVLNGKYPLFGKPIGKSKDEIVDIETRFENQVASRIFKFSGFVGL